MAAPTFQAQLMGCMASAVAYVSLRYGRNRQNGALQSKKDISSKSSNVVVVGRKRLPARRGTGNVSPGRSRRRLLEVYEVPEYLRFNPYVHTGYRPMLSVSQSLKSLMYFHNETVNILTHGIPLFYVLGVLPTLLPWSEMKTPLLPYLHTISMISPWLGSFIYHTFMNHTTGSNTYHQLLKWDVLGVWLAQASGTITGLYTTIFHLERSLKICAICAYTLLCLWSFCYAIWATCPWQRRNCFAPLIVTRIVFLLLRLTATQNGDPQAVFHLLMLDFWSILGAIISAMHIPERWFPGKFDWIFNSHNLMHVMVVLGGVHVHHAAKKDLKWLSDRWY